MAKFSKKTLENGLRIITVPVPAESVTVAVFVGVGSRYETKENNGISHFLEHMAFKGTDKFSSLIEIVQAIEGFGGVYNAGTQKEWTSYWIKIPKERLSSAFDILEEVVFHSLYRKEDIERERGVIIEEINMYEDDARMHVMELVDGVVWPNHPLGRNIAGTKETVQNLKRKDFLKYIKSLYLPSKIIVAAAGAVEGEAFSKLVTERLGGLKDRKPKDFLKVKETQKKPRSVLQTRKTEQTHLCLVSRAYSYSHPDRFVMGLLSVILGGGATSRLFQKIREERGLAYDVHAMPFHQQDTGGVQIYAGVDHQKAEETLKFIISEIQNLKTGLVTKKELEVAKERTKGHLALSLEDSARRLSWICFQDLLLKDILTYEQTCQKFEAVTAAEIKRVACDIFVNKRLNLAVIGPFKDKGKFEKILKFDD